MLPVCLLCWSLDACCITMNLHCSYNWINWVFWRTFSSFGTLSTSLSLRWLAACAIWAWDTCRTKLNWHICTSTICRIECMWLLERNFVLQILDMRYSNSTLNGRYGLCWRTYKGGKRRFGLFVSFFVKYFGNVPTSLKLNRKIQEVHIPSSQCWIGVWKLTESFVLRLCTPSIY